MSRYQKMVMVLGSLVIVALVGFQNCEEQDLVMLEDLQRREKEVKALAKTACEVSADCRAIPMGRKPCGGPRTYLLYSVVSVEDESDLIRRVDEYTELENQWALRSDVVGDCRFIAPPAELVCDESRVCVGVGERSEP